MKSTLSKILAAAFITMCLLSCEKDAETIEVSNPLFNIRGNASGAQEAPNKVTTTATGTLSGTYNKNTNTLTYTINWTGLTGGNPTAMHFHGPADPGVAAGVVVGITGFPATVSGTISGTATLTDAQEADLVNGLWYYNIHNATNPPGEIRGQVVLAQ